MALESIGHSPPDDNFVLSIADLVCTSILSDLTSVLMTPFFHIIRKRILS